MANKGDIYKVALPNGDEYNFKDKYVRENYRALNNNDFDTINVTELNAGNVIVTGAARFLNTINGSISGNAATATTASSANSVAWGNVSGRPTKLSQFTNDITFATSIASSTDTSEITLAHGGVYALTAGGTSFVFKMPSSGNTDTKVRQTLITDTDNTNRPLLLSYSNTSTTTGNVDNISYRANTIYANASTGAITATKFVGALQGNADTATSATSATKATQDSDGNTINTTYLKKSGGTMTGVLTLKGSQYEDSYSGSLNANNSNIYNLNSIYTADSADAASEGIHFYRDATHVDSLWVAGGNIMFVPNRALGTNTTAANSQKVGRFTANPTSGQVVITDGTTGGMKSSGYTIATSVPSGAKFTDTTYSAGTGLTLSGTQFSVSSANASTIINLLSTGDSAPSDADYYVAQYAGGGTSTTSYHRRPHSALWSYIKGKADTIYSPIGHTHDYIPLITNEGLGTVSGGGNYSWFKIATLTITATYVNGPVIFELSQRQYAFSTIQVCFVSADNKDPRLSYFTTDYDNHYYIKKTDTSTWELYGAYNEKWGTCSLHRVSGCRCNNGVSVSVKMENISAPTDVTQVSYGGNVAYATKATQDGAGNTITSTYLPLAGGTMSGNIIFPNTVSIYQNQNSTSNYTTIVEWKKGGTSQATYDPEIGQHNTGGSDKTGSIILLPYATDTDPWNGSVGLFIAKNTIKLDNKYVGRFTVNPISGQVVVTDGTDGGIKSSGYTIAKSVPSDAVFTDTDHTYNLTSTNDSLQIVTGTSGDNTIWDVSVVKVNGHTVNEDVPSGAVFTDQYVSQSVASTNKWRKILLSYQGDTTAGAAVTANTNVVYETPNAEINPSTGSIRSAGDITATIFGVNASNGTSGGISLYSGAGNVDNYGIAFRKTTDKEKHGYVQSDWATYFTMNSGATTRGWVYRLNQTNGNVASISGAGNLVLNGSVTIGGNITNTSGARMQYNASTNAIDFVFVA